MRRSTHPTAPPARGGEKKIKHARVVVAQAQAEGDYHPGCYPSLVAGSYPRDRLESHRVEDRPP